MRLWKLHHSALYLQISKRDYIYLQTSQHCRWFKKKKKNGGGVGWGEIWRRQSVLKGHGYLMVLTSNLHPIPLTTSSPPPTSPSPKTVFTAFRESKTWTAALTWSSLTKINPVPRRSKMTLASELMTAASIWTSGTGAEAKTVLTRRRQSSVSRRSEHCNAGLINWHPQYGYGSSTVDLFKYAFLHTASSVGGFLPTKKYFHQRKCLSILRVR